MSKKSSKHIKIDVCKLDVLWRRLEGFADDYEDLKDPKTCSKGYRLSCWKEIIRIAGKSSASWREVKELAEKYEKSYGGLRVVISEFRHGKRNIPLAFKSELRT